LKNVPLHGLLDVRAVVPLVLPACDPSRAGRFGLGQRHEGPLVEPLSLAPLAGRCPSPRIVGKVPGQRACLPLTSLVVDALGPWWPAPPARRSIPSSRAIRAGPEPSRRPCPQPPSAPAPSPQMLARASLWPAHPWSPSAPHTESGCILPT
jgi:hypothetical protein